MLDPKLQLLGIQIKSVNEYESSLADKFENSLSNEIVSTQQHKLDELDNEIQELHLQIENYADLVTKPLSLSQLKKRLEEKQQKKDDLMLKITFLLKNQEKANETCNDFEDQVRKGILMPMDSSKQKSVVNFDASCELFQDENDEEIVFEKMDGEQRLHSLKDDSCADSFEKRILSWKYFDEFVENCRSVGNEYVSYKYRESNEKYIDDSFFVPFPIMRHLFRYQKTGVRWLYSLYEQKVGGILADEMGLGKTIQVIAFISALFVSKLNHDKSALIVCPVTLLQQWMEEFHKWFPLIPVRVAHSQSSKESLSALKNISTPSVVITSYSLLQQNPHFFTRGIGWCSVFLDEGHKIRNHQTSISQIAKKLPSKHRVLISGTPIQNNLSELWSLFDFVFPGRLGSLPIFQAEFEEPIRRGGYSNASSLQVETAYSCSVSLKSLIAPYMLRRVKADVATDLPEKKEHILFCKLTQTQQKMYRSFIRSEDFEMIVKGRRHVLSGIDYLRKICNHLALLEPKQSSMELEDSSIKEMSGKLNVLKNLLQDWHKKHKVLIFCQTRQMLDLIEDNIKTTTSYSFLRMDGNTPVNQRTSLIDKFNSDSGICIFLLTTKVGGLGINLTGADRVVIFDPDWNPSTDSQAKERAWRLGQDKPVMILRLITAGTIEEKIYHRQVFKQFLTNKILLDPKKCMFFKSTDLYDLFTYSENDDSTETSEIFESLSHDIKKSDNILETIAASAGVHSIINHEGIIDSRSNSEYQLVKREADKVANDALNSLKNGSKKSKRSVDGLRISNASNTILTTLLPVEDDKYSKIMQSIVEFMKERKSICKSEEIVQKFESKGVSPMIFKILLQKVASFDKKERLWRLNKNV